MAFFHVYNLSGGRPLILEITAKDTESLHEGDMLNVETGEADLAATNDTAFMGVLVSASDPASYTRIAGATYGTINAVDSTTVLKAVANPDAVYTDRVTGTARLAGVQLDIAGATAAQVLATDSNHDFNVIKSVTSSEEPLVIFVQAETYLY